MAKKAKPRYKTFRLRDRTGTLAEDILVVGESFHAYRVVYKERHCLQWRVADGTIVLAHVAENFEASMKENSIYYKQSTSPELLAQLFTSLRDIAVKEGATPEAIRLLSEATGAFTKKEENEMAEKLKAKASAAKPDKDGLKSAANKTPVGKATAPKRKGNPEALAKARAARQTGPDTRKIKANIKVKDIAARPGTARYKMLTDLLGSKTVQEFRDKGYSSGDLNYATGANIVSVG
jgi:hypothetical protein